MHEDWVDFTMIHEMTLQIKHIIRVCLV